MRGHVKTEVAVRDGLLSVPVLAGRPRGGRLTTLCGQGGNGANSSVLSGQAVRLATTMSPQGRTQPLPGAEDQPAKGGFGAQLRERGAVATAFVVIGGIAANGLLVSRR